MNKSIYSVITGTGSYIPTDCIRNDHFLDNEFYDSDGTKLSRPNQEIIEKFFEITTIAERRYVTNDLVTSDIAGFAANEAIKAAGIDKEELDYLIVAHNFGDVRNDNRRKDIVPSLASRIKHKLAIKNHNSVAYDIIFGCPGWLQGIIQADYLIKSGDAKKILIIGADILSRVSDPSDRDSMLYADGAGAVILEAKESDQPVGILAHRTRSDTFLHSEMLYMGKSYKINGIADHDTYLKMNGRKLYQYAIENVPQTIRECLEKSNTHITEIKKALIHQANGKMDDAILKRLFTLYGINHLPEHIMPMTIGWLGNSSVATIPTLLDLIMNGKLEPHKLDKGDTIIMASVGAGMNINSMTYRL
jgi:3-oxoacyl-[acyl-carrier-protein] synthase III